MLRSKGHVIAASLALAAPSAAWAQAQNDILIGVGHGTAQAMLAASHVQAAYLGG